MEKEWECGHVYPQGQRDLRLQKEERAGLNRRGNPLRCRDRHDNGTHPPPPPLPLTTTVQTNPANHQRKWLRYIIIQQCKLAMCTIIVVRILMCVNVWIHTYTVHRRYVYRIRTIETYVHKEVSRTVLYVLMYCGRDIVQPKHWRNSLNSHSPFSLSKALILLSHIHWLYSSRWRQGEEWSSCSCSHISSSTARHRRLRPSPGTASGETVNRELNERWFWRVKINGCDCTFSYHVRG